jgi:hypothetical protein
MKSLSYDIDETASRDIANTQHPCNRSDGQRWVGERREIDEKHAVWISVQQLRGNLEANASFARRAPDRATSV